MGQARRAGEDVFRGNAAAAGNRARVSAHAEDSIPGRADAGAGPAEPEPALDSCQEAERSGWRHRFPHDTLHGRSRPGGGPHRRNRSRKDRSDRDGERAEATDRNGIAGRSVFGADGLDDSRGGREFGGPDAAVCEDVEGRRAAMNAIYILWLREVKKYTRSRVQIVASLGQPLLYLLVLGFGLGPVFQKAGGGSYLQFMAPGIVGMAVLFTSVFSGIALLWDRQFGFLKETLVAPVPRIQIMAGRTLGGATVSMIQGSLVIIISLIAGLRPVSWAGIPLAIGFMAAIAIVFAALGTALGASLQDMQGFQLVMNFLVLPIFFLSGALFPLNNLPAALKIVTRIDPLSYGVDGLRGALIGTSFFGIAFDAGALAIAAIVLLCLGAWRFSKIEI